MSLPPVKNAVPSADNKLLRFGCPACGIRLVVDQSIAGTEGPCPSCGAVIVAPPLGVSSDLSGRIAAPLEVKPRQTGGAATAEMQANPLTDKASASEGSSADQVYKPSRRRSVSPTSVISDKHQEKANTLQFFKILCAVLVIALIVAAVYLVLKEAQ